ncbi:hypothetical protein CLOM621_07373 [Clostridium sp. M62/1]|nr:hypothetical protein CLOM621_07373 [Clostridium sp. M62/1]
MEREESRSSIKKEALRLLRCCRKASFLFNFLFFHSVLFAQPLVQFYFATT